VGWRGLHSTDAGSMASRWFVTETQPRSDLHQHAATGGDRPRDWSGELGAMQFVPLWSSSQLLSARRSTPCWPIGITERFDGGGWPSQSGL